VTAVPNKTMPTAIVKTAVRLVFLLLMGQYLMIKRFGSGVI